MKRMWFPIRKGFGPDFDRMALSRVPSAAKSEVLIDFDIRHSSWGAPAVVHAPVLFAVDADATRAKQPNAVSEASVSLHDRLAAQLYRAYAAGGDIEGYFAAIEGIATADANTLAAAKKMLMHVMFRGTASVRAEAIRQTWALPQRITTSGTVDEEILLGKYIWGMRKYGRSTTIAEIYEDVSKGRLSQARATAVSTEIPTVVPKIDRSRRLAVG